MILDLLRRILIHDPAQRAKLTDIQIHQWLSKVYPQGNIILFQYIYIYIYYFINYSESDHRKLFKPITYVMFFSFTFQKDFFREKYQGPWCLLKEPNKSAPSTVILI